MELINKIKSLEILARQLEPNPSQRAAWNEGVQHYADEFLDQISTLNAYDIPPQDSAPPLELTEKGRGLNEILAGLKLTTDRSGINPASGGHLGYVPGGGVFPTALGDYLAAVTNRYAGLYFANPGAVELENQLIRWMCSFIGYPDSALGNLSSGGSIANLIAITTARDYYDITGEKIKRAVVYTTEHVHHCLQKALRIAGLKDTQIRYIPVDEQFRMRTDVLQVQLAEDVKNDFIPFLIVGSAGTTNTGAIDPLEPMAMLARQYRAWFHVDAAYGGFFMISDNLKDKFKGIEQSDSVTIDPHKGLFLSYGLGAVLVKNVEAQYQSHYYSANYMQDAHQGQPVWSPADLSPELTKHFRGLRMWLPLQLLGIRTFRAALEEKIALCQFFYHEVQHIGFQVGPFPELSIMIFRYPAIEEANAFNQALMQHIREDGKFFLSSTTIDGVFWMRLAVLSFRTHLNEIQTLLQMLQSYVSSIHYSDGPNYLEFNQ